MSLSGGTRLGAYEIIALVGAGGMGDMPRLRAALVDRQIGGLLDADRWIGG